MNKIPSSEFMQFISQIYGNLLPYLRALYEMNEKKKNCMTNIYAVYYVCVWG